MVNWLPPPTPPSRPEPQTPSKSIQPPAPDHTPRGWESRGIIIDLSSGSERIPTPIPGWYYHPNDIQAPHTEPPAEQPTTSCGTCVSRTYQDQSSDIGVSFSGGASVAPEAAASLVFAHEREHAAIAHQEAQRTGGHADTAIRVHTSICPDCKKVYVSGGEARISITPSEEDVADIYSDPAEALIGQLLDIAV
jgi:hypothetical protein